MSEMRAKKPQYTPLEPSKQLDARLNNILNRIAKNERGMKMLKWAEGHQIKFQFAAPFEGFVEFSNVDAPDAEGNTPEPQPRTEISGGLVELNINAPDEVLIIFIFDQLRRAWHDKVARLEGPNLSIASNIISNRFEEADAISYTTCMCLDMAINQGDGALMAALSRLPSHVGSFEAADLTGSLYGYDFDRMRRTLFEEFLSVRNMENLAETEAQYAHAVLEVIQSNLKEVAAHSVTQLMEWQKDKKGPKPEIMANVPYFYTLPADKFAYFGNPGFGMEGENYLTMFTNRPVNSERFMWITPEVKKIIADFVETNPSYNGKGLLGQLATIEYLQHKKAENANALSTPKKSKPAPKL